MQAAAHNGLILKLIQNWNSCKKQLSMGEGNTENALRRITQNRIHKTLSVLAKKNNPSLTTSARGWLTQCSQTCQWCRPQKEVCSCLEFNKGRVWIRASRFPLHDSFVSLLVLKFGNLIYCASIIRCLVLVKSCTVNYVCKYCQSCLDICKSCKTITLSFFYFYF